MHRRLLYITAFVANACVLVVEISGARLLAPYIGTSTEVWAGLIAVILGGLAIGYWLGGYFAKNNPSYSRLTTLLLLAGFAILVTWMLKDIIPVVAVSISDGSLTFLAMSVGIVLFGPASIFIGAVSPYTTRLALTDIDTSAPVIGRMTAIGTIGAIVGALLTGEYLLPYFGLASIFLGVSMVLFLLSLLVGLRSRKLALAAVVAMLITILLGSYGTPIAYSEDTIDDIETPYGRILVRETQYNGKSLRYVSTGPEGLQCGMHIENGVPDPTTIPFGYLRGFFISDAAVPNPERALMLGGCNYSHTRAFLLKHPDAAVTVVELDPGMTEAAKKWFGLEESPAFNIVHADARVFLNQNTDAYDVIFMDTFTTYGAIPYQLATKEAASQLSKKLADNGVLVINVIGGTTGEHSVFPEALFNTFAEVFETMDVYSVQGKDPSVIQNLLFIASHALHTLPETFDTNEEVFVKAPADLLTQFEMSNLILTDDFAPVENLTASMRKRGAQ
jgi:predicted membrane-bound spermidine synthase